jgi:hypothetical protein
MNDKIAFSSSFSHSSSQYSTSLGSGQSKLWHPLFMNVTCYKVPLTEVPGVLDKCTFDIVSKGGAHIAVRYTILAEDHGAHGRVSIALYYHD